MGSCGTGHNHAQFSDLAGVINFGADLADAHMPGTREERIIRLERDILSKKGAFARANRDRLKAAGISRLTLSRALAPVRRRCWCGQSLI